MHFVRLFDLCLYGFSWLPLPLGVWEGLQFVIVALPGFFSYLIFILFSFYTCISVVRKNKPWVIPILVISY